MNTHTLSNKNKKKKAFTLVEIMVAAVILLLMIGIVLNFFVEHLRAGFVSEQRNLVNIDMRRFTQEMVNNGRSASYFTMYNSFASADRDTSTDRLSSGNAGDLIVFVYQTAPNPSDPNVRPIEKIIGYYKDTSTGTVKTFTKEFSPASSNSVESLIPAVSEAASFRDVAEDFEGLSNGRLFYNNKSSIVVNGNVMQGHDVKPVTNTYTFTIKPRG